MVIFGPLAAAIGSVVWGTQANFNGFFKNIVLWQVCHNTIFFEKIMCCGRKNKVADTCHHTIIYSIQIYSWNLQVWPPLAAIGTFVCIEEVIYIQVEEKALLHSVEVQFFLVQSRQSLEQSSK